MKLCLLLAAFLFSNSSFASISRLLGASTIDGIFAPGNLVANGGFEKDAQFWTASGGTFTQNSLSNFVGRGSYSASWDSNSASQTLTSNAFGVPAGYAGRDGTVSCLFKAASGTATHTLSVVSSNISLASQTITSSTSTFRRSTKTFTMPAAGSKISLRITSVASDEPVLYIDSCVISSSDELPFLGASAINAVLSNSTSERIERAYITNNGSSCTVSNQSGSWINTTGTRNGNGDCSMSILSGIFSVNPTCTCTGELDVGVAAYNCNLVVSSTTAFRVQTYTIAGTNTDRPINIICYGAR